MDFKVVRLLKRDTEGSSYSECASLPTKSGDYHAGLNSSGQLCKKSSSMLGITPTLYRACRVDEVIRFAVGQCFLGAYWSP
jgi:hypothetical protein